MVVNFKNNYFKKIFKEILDNIEDLKKELLKIDDVCIYFICFFSEQRDTRIPPLHVTTYFSHIYFHISPLIQKILEFLIV